MQLFVNDRRAIAKPAMKAKRVVPRLQEVKDLAPRLFMRGEVRARKQFTFKCGEEGFAHGVVKAVANAAHRRAHTGLKATPAEGDRRVLGEFNRSSQHPEIRELQWQQQNMVAVDVVFVRR